MCSCFLLFALKPVNVFYEVIADLERTRRGAVKKATRNFTTQKIKEDRRTKWERESGYLYETGEKKKAKI